MSLREQHLVSTDVNGFYQITKVPAGTYELQSTYLGYDTASVSVVLEAKKSVTQALYLGTSSVKLEVVEVSADRQEARTEVRTSVTKIT